MYKISLIIILYEILPDFYKFFKKILGGNPVRYAYTFVYLNIFNNNSHL